MSKFISNTESIYAGPNQPFDIHCLIIFYRQKGRLFFKFGYCHFNHTVDFSYVRSAKLSLDRGRIFCDDDTGQCASLDARVGKLQPTESPLNDLRDSYYFIFIRGSKCLWIKKVGA